MFSSSFDYVVLIEKAKPAWMAGHLNGVGGKVEANESAAEAMVREFREETGLDTQKKNWIRVTALHEPGVTVDVFACIDSRSGMAKTMTPEPIRVIDWDYRLAVSPIHYMPNILWLIPMCRWALKKPYHFPIDMIGGLS